MNKTYKNRQIPFIACNLKDALLKQNLLKGQRNYESEYVWNSCNVLWVENLECGASIGDEM